MPALVHDRLLGEVYGPGGERIHTGSRIEAYVGDTLCGVASIRSSGLRLQYGVVGPIR
jgi:hypothetical protein